MEQIGLMLIVPCYAALGAWIDDTFGWVFSAYGTAGALMTAGILYQLQ